MRVDLRVVESLWASHHHAPYLVGLLHPGDLLHHTPRLVVLPVQNPCLVALLQPAPHLGSPHQQDLHLLGPHLLEWAKPFLISPLAGLHMWPCMATCHFPAIPLVSIHQMVLSSIQHMLLLCTWLTWARPPCIQLQPCNSSMRHLNMQRQQQLYMMQQQQQAMLHDAMAQPFRVDPIGVLPLGARRLREAERKQQKQLQRHEKQRRHRQRHP